MCVEVAHDDQETTTPFLGMEVIKPYNDDQQYLEKFDELQDKGYAIVKRGKSTVID